MPDGGATGVVLVVDDEASIRLLCKINLELSGYEVREASSLDEARSLLGDDVDAVLLDMHVGRERGEELLAELRDRSIPVAVVTGSVDLLPVADKADAVLGKPFTIDALVATVAKLTSGHG